MVTEPEIEAQAHLLNGQPFDSHQSQMVPEVLGESDY